MRVLHLGFEDHKRPGSGGGSRRNQEINTRLVGMGMEVEVCVAAFHGARARVEHGVRYRHRGVSRGYAPSLLSYQMRLPWDVALASRRGYDLIVEDFAPLTSTLGIGHWTGIPTVGLVQGYFARAKAEEYHLPVRLMTAIERWGTRSHLDLIAVSSAIGEQLSVVAPNSRVTVIPNGVDLAAATQAVSRRNAACEDSPYILYLGRLEMKQKGLDFLLESLPLIDAKCKLIVAGSGKDEQRFRTALLSAGLGDRVQMVGAVQGTVKWDLLANAELLVLPSRYETFGISALEAMACGVPVVASDLECLRDLVGTRAGRLVSTGAPIALAAAVNELLLRPAEREALGRTGQEIAADFEWERLAREQAQVYARAIARRRHPADWR